MLKRYMMGQKMFPTLITTNLEHEQVLLTRASAGVCIYVATISGT